MATIVISEVEDAEDHKVELGAETAASLKDCFGKAASSKKYEVKEIDSDLDPGATSWLGKEAKTYDDLVKLGHLIDEFGVPTISACLIHASGDVTRTAELMKSTPPEGPFKDTESYVMSLRDNGTLDDELVAQYFNYQKFGRESLMSRQYSTRNGHLTVFG